MINSSENPVSFALLLTELDEARAHLEELICKMNESGAVDDPELAVCLGHIYAHLNRAWHSRNLDGEKSEEQWPVLSRFPKDLDPVG